MITSFEERKPSIGLFRPVDRTYDETDQVINAHRHGMLSPGTFTGENQWEPTDLSDAPLSWQDEAAKAWTPEVVAAYQAAFPWVPSPPPPFIALSRPAFLFMMEKLGITKEAVHALIDAMPEGKPEEVDAKALARIVFDEQQSFARDNGLLKVLTAKAGLTDEQVDAAWRIGEGLKW